MRVALFYLRRLIIALTGDEVFDHLVGNIVFELFRRVLHEVGGRGVKDAALAPVEGYLF